MNSPVVPKPIGWGEVKTNLTRFPLNLQHGIDPHKPSDPKSFTPLKEGWSKREQHRSTCKDTEIEREEWNSWITPGKANKQTVESCDQVFRHDFQKLTDMQITCKSAQKLDGETTERMRHEFAELKKEMEEKKYTGQKWKQHWTQQQGNTITLLKVWWTS